MSALLGRALVAATADLDPRLRDRVLARIAGPIGEAARAAAREAPTREQRAQWAATARLPTPIGLRTIHPSWIEAAVVELPAMARGAMVGQGHDRASIWLARWACANLATIEDPRLDRSAEDLIDWLRDIGADQIAVAARAAGPELHAAMVRKFPAIAGRPRPGDHGPARATIARCRDLIADLDAFKLSLIGARCVAPHLDGIARRAIVVRMPKNVGTAIAHEFETHATTPLDQVPAWSVLAPS